MSDKETLYVLDGSYYVFRAFYAIRSLSNSKGMPTNGLFAFTNMLLNVIRDQRPHYLAVAFDPRGGTFRNELYEDYKANRSEPPEELVLQMPYFRDIVKALNIPVLEVENYEADDVIGTLVRSAHGDGRDVTILSGDKDLFQLLDDSTWMVDSMRDKHIGLDEVHERFNVGPERVTDVLALAGDTSDNIPGVPGIGEKTAGKLIAEFGSLEELLSRIDEVSGKKRKENLHAFADQARLSHQLVTIKTDVPLDVTIDDLRLSAPDFAAFDKLCAELEFNRFPDMLRELFGDASHEYDEERLEGDAYQTVWTREKLEEVASAAREAGYLSFDLETTSLNPLDAEIVGFALAVEAGQSFYVPVAHQGLEGAAQLSLDEALEVIRPLLEDPDVGLIIQNASYELRVMARYGIELAKIETDTMLAAWLIDSNKRRYGLDSLAREYLGRSMISFTDVAGKGKSQKRFDEVSIEEATNYAAEDADVTLQLRNTFAGALANMDQRAVLEDIELPLCRVLARMETRGIRVDRERLKELSDEFSERIDELEAQVFEAAGEEFLINSPAQLRVILFEKLGLPVIKKTKTGPSTDQSVLETLQHEHALPRLILDYRHLTKLRSTYVDALPALIHPKTGRVHTSYNQAGTATGRLSSSDPNLQNIPVRSEDGRRIREAFVPEEGWVLIGGDYSQIELRMLAHFSEDEVLIDAFQKGEDIHRRTASEVFEVAPEEVTSDQRAAAKAINFGLIYGMGAHRLADELGIPRAQAAEYIDRYFARLKGVRPYFEELVAQAREQGYASTLSGRRRPIAELSSGRPHIAAQGERLAMNTPIQGSAADLLKLAMLRIDERMTREGYRSQLLLQVHDELIFECPPEEADAMMALAREEMENAVELRVPLRVDFSSAATWAGLK